MEKAAASVADTLSGLGQQAVGQNPALADVLEAARCLITDLNGKPPASQPALAHLDQDSAICVSALFSTHGASSHADDARSEHRGYLLHQHILQNLSDGITVQDTDFNIIYQNDAMLAAFGSHLGEKCYAVYERRATPCEGCGLAKAFQTGKPTMVLRTAFAADGTTSFWENACFPVFDDDRRIIAGVEVCRNVSARVSLEEEVKDRNIQLGQLNEELKRQAARLEEALHRREQAEQELRREMERREHVEVLLRHAQKLQAVGQLAAGIAHEINTPAQFVAHNLAFLRDSFADIQAVLDKYHLACSSLSSVPGCEEAVRRLAEAEETADMTYVQRNVPVALSDALQGIARISTIVGAMKEFGQADHSGKSAADLNQALQVTLTVARAEYANVADVETDFQPLPPVLCHLGDMNQVFLSLLVNAAHAISDVVGQSGRKGRIRIRTRCEGDHVRVDIEDTGCGVAPQIRDRIFEPFFTTKDVGRGSGQGLAIAYSIVVNKHQGSLTFHSEPGLGTTFTILLPTAQSAQ